MPLSRMPCHPAQTRLDCHLPPVSPSHATGWQLCFRLSRKAPTSFSLLLSLPARQPSLQIQQSGIKTPYPRLCVHPQSGDHMSQCGLGSGEGDRAQGLLVLQSQVGGRGKRRGLQSDYPIFPRANASSSHSTHPPLHLGLVGGYVAEGGRAWVLVVLNLPDGTETSAPAGWQMVCE